MSNGPLIVPPALIAIRPARQSMLKNSMQWLIMASDYIPGRDSHPATSLRTHHIVRDRGGLRIAVSQLAFSQDSGNKPATRQQDMPDASRIASPGIARSTR